MTKTAPEIEQTQCIKCGEVISHTYLWKHIKDKHIEMIPILQDNATYPESHKEED